MNLKGKNHHCLCSVYICFRALSLSHISAVKTPSPPLLNHLERLPLCVHWVSLLLRSSLPIRYLPAAIISLLQHSCSCSHYLYICLCCSQTRPMHKQAAEQTNKHMHSLIWLHPLTAAPISRAVCSGAAIRAVARWRGNVWCVSVCVVMGWGIQGLVWACWGSGLGLVLLSLGQQLLWGMFLSFPPLLSKRFWDAG